MKSHDLQMIGRISHQKQHHPGSPGDRRRPLLRKKWTNFVCHASSPNLLSNIEPGHFLLQIRSPYYFHYQHLPAPEYSRNSHGCFVPSNEGFQYPPESVKHRVGTFLSNRIIHLPHIHLPSSRSEEHTSELQSR